MLIIVAIVVWHSRRVIPETEVALVDEDANASNAEGSEHQLTAFESATRGLGHALRQCIRQVSVLRVQVATGTVLLALLVACLYYVAGASLPLVRHMLVAVEKVHESKQVIPTKIASFSVAI